MYDHACTHMGWTNVCIWNRTYSLLNDCNTVDYYWLVGSSEESSDTCRMKPVRKRLNNFQVNFVQAKKGPGIKTTLTNYCISAENDTNPAVLHQAEQKSTMDYDTEYQHPDGDVLAESSSYEQSSSYERRKDKLADGWAQLRESLVHCKIQTYGYPSRDPVCVHCGLANALILCKDCGPCAYHCTECAIKHHSTVNIMHRLLIWKVCMYTHTSVHIRTKAQMTPACILQIM